jgi:hypothetical protein
MQVNVFIAREDGQLQNKLLALPTMPTAAILKECRDGWTYFARVETGDGMFGDLDVASLEKADSGKGLLLWCRRRRIGDDIFIVTRDFIEPSSTFD